jgi:indolepyruvate ferredoxin oxidoreductase alpha subunit
MTYRFSMDKQTIIDGSVLQAGCATEFRSGNQAIAQGILESGCEIATAYPGTPSTEIMEEMVSLKERFNLDLYLEWSINEKVAFDIAYAATICGKRAAVSMKQVGLNVASDSLLSAAYTGVIGGFVIVSCDDPGPHSSQTEQDTRLFSIFAKVPVLDPSTPQEALEMTKYAFELSERFRIPVILRPTTRICHGSSAVTTSGLRSDRKPARFNKDSDRWAATPPFRLKLHKELEEKLAVIRQEFESCGVFNYTTNEQVESSLGLICSGAAYSTAHDILLEAGIRLPVLKIGTVHPLPLKLVESFVQKYRSVLVLEEPDKAVEIQIRDRRSVLGRETGNVPSFGELTPEVVYESLRRAMVEVNCPGVLPEQRVPEIPVDFIPPTLCPGCGHRAAFFAIRKAKPTGIFPSDIGCYTLGLNLKAVDTVLDMGAGITIADGVSKAYKMDGESIPIIATIGDSTFFHAGVPGLLNACVTGSAFVLVVLDNSITAMTGFQSTPESGRQADGREVPKVSIRDMVKACGVEFIEEIDAYEVDDLIALVKRAQDYARTNSRVAVIISRHSCVLNEPNTSKVKVKVLDTCNGCRYCLTFFECPALKFDRAMDQVFIDYSICTDCGVCIEACPPEAIVAAQ